MNEKMQSHLNRLTEMGIVESILVEKSTFLQEASMRQRAKPALQDGLSSSDLRSNFDDANGVSDVGVNPAIREESQ